MDYSEKFNKLISSVNDENKQKLIYTRNFWSDKYIVDNYEYIMDKFSKVSIDKLNTFNTPIEDEYKEVFEYIDPSNISELLIKDRETIRASNVVTDSMLLFADHLDISNSVKAKLVNTNYIYEKYTKSDALTYRDILDAIKNEFTQIKDNKDFDILEIEESIHTAIGNKITERIDQNYGGMENFKNTKKGEVPESTLNVIDVATKTNKIYEIESGLVHVIAQNKDKLDFSTVDNIVKEAGFLQRYPDTQRACNYAKDCFIENKSINIDDVENVLQSEIDEFFTPTIFEYMKKHLETYKEFGSFDVSKLSKDTLNNLDKSKVKEAMQYTHNIYDSNTIMLMSILGDRFNEFNPGEKSKLSSYLRYFDMSQEDINFFRDNVDEIKNPDYSLSDVYYIKNIRCNEDVKKALEKFPEDIQEQILSVNVQANNYEIANILEALTTYKEEPSERDSFSNIQRNLSSVPAQKRDALRQLVMDSGIRNFSPKLGLNENTTIGVELEVEGISDKIVKKLVDNKELLHTLLEHQHINSNVSEWEIKHEESVRTGVEVTSPILKDNESDWKSLQSVCQLLKSIGGKTDETCGGHVHIGANILGTDSKAWENLFKIWSNCEEILYKISNPPNQSLREDVGKFAAPTKPIIDEILKYDTIDIKDEKDIQKLSKFYTSMYVDENNENGKYKGMNLNCIATGKQNTIEFRVPNGQLDPIEIQRNINLYARMVDVSKQMSEDPEYKKDLMEGITDDEIGEEDKLLYLLDLTFDNIADKAVYYERYLSRDKELVVSGKDYKEYVKKKPKMDDGIR